MSTNPTPHINRARIKRTALEVANSKTGPCYRACGFTRVGEDFYQAIEAAVRKEIVNRIKSNTSSKTLT